MREGFARADIRRSWLYFNLLFCRSVIYVPEGAFALPSAQLRF